MHFEDNVSPSTNTINLLAYVENKERAQKQVGLWLYLKICRAQRGGKKADCGYVFFKTKGMKIIWNMEIIPWIRTKFPDFP